MNTPTNTPFASPMNTPPSSPLHWSGDAFADMPPPQPFDLFDMAVHTFVNTLAEYGLSENIQNIFRDELIDGEVIDIVMKDRRRGQYDEWFENLDFAPDDMNILTNWWGMYDLMT